MIYFCADDYGISEKSNERIQNCLENGVLNKVSVLPNGKITDFKKCLDKPDTVLSLHINLVDSYALSDCDKINLLVSDDGTFKYSFVGIFLVSLTTKRRILEQQLYIELQNQLRFWKKAVGDDVFFSIDSHQHTHMIPVVFKTLMKVIKDEGLKVDSIRIPNEPLLPYLLTPSLYFSYKIKGLVKHWLLKILALVNDKELKKSQIPYSYFMGVMFSGRLNQKVIKKLLPHYLKMAEKKNKDIEIAFHPGYVNTGEKVIDGSRADFGKFYYSPLRKAEYDTLINFNI